MSGKAVLAMLVFGLGSWGLLIAVVITLVSAVRALLS